MTFIAQVRVKHPDLVLTRTLAALPEVEVVHQSHQTAAETMYAFYFVSGPALDDFEDRAKRDPTVADPVLIDDLGGRRLYRIVLSPDALLLGPTLASLGIAVVDARASSGVWRLKLHVPDRERLAGFNDHCVDQDVSLRVTRLSRAESSGGDRTVPLLTEAQREALLTALRNGYYEEPRETDLEELSRELGISSTAVGGRLRRGTATLIQSLLLEDENGE